MAEKTKKKSSASSRKGKKAVLKAEKRDKPIRSNRSKKRTNKTSAKKNSAATKPWFKKLFYYGAVASVWSVIIGVVLLGYLAHDLPDMDNLPHPGAGDPAVIVKAANGVTLVRQGPIYGDWIPYQEVPEALIMALTSVEDRYFFAHNGFDGRGFLRAIYTNVRAGRVRAGGSTITQQLAKNMFLTNVRSFKRKAQELLLSFWLEQKFTKKQILSLYLNRTYFGGGAYGIDAASQKFFGHSARSLSVAESALLAGLVKSPSTLAPHINAEGAWERAQVVLGTMVDADAINQTAAKKIAAQPPIIKTSPVGNDVRYFSDWAIREARKQLGDNAPRSLVIYTTLDPAIQRAGSLAIKRGLDQESAKHGVGQAALVAVDHDGAVRAMIGGANYGKSQYNRAAQAQRQPGSAFKLFSYLAAMEQGVSISDQYIDEKLTIDGWSPKNYTGVFNGPMTVREAFARSINTIAVQVAEEAGRENVAEMAKRLGIQTNISPVASLPLGTEEVRLIDLAGAYAVLANGGHKANPYGIIEITSLEGEVLYRRQAQAPMSLLDVDIVRDMTNMLTAVITWGSGKNAKIDRPAAGKSGTSQDSRDALFAGFTSDLSCVVWVGNDDGTPMRGVTGGGLPARIWADFMLDAHVGLNPRPLLADAVLYENALTLDDSDAPTKKKKRGIWTRLFGGE
ncbi:transglycosylase domain-containing protein [Kordiimonas sp. SCSIO 12610]|uniref:transglycosylase domain-containing protein n=1 Tax=Kordiimonas sp. SCSIO 12610 TaxID=2829597 RepID=UPI00210C5ADF|nr:PBP1A family penicillin-binding protein [Kordiimonas sp. SCSIO 12610]UTW55082.1 PBP1A family penicillin-binding protein [Kordiimonas sp. SCSIO 12610]